MIYLSKGGGPVPIRTIRGSAPGAGVRPERPKRDACEWTTAEFWDPSELKFINEM